MPGSNTAILSTGTAYLDKDETAVLKAILYFDIFEHPLKLDEIKNFCMSRLTDLQLNITIESLLQKQLLVKKNGLYLLNLSDNYKAALRLESNARAEKRMSKARFFSKLISKFPFVRAVFISGSLSKGVMHKNSDVDYFIITSSGRLWLTRMMLVLFKRIFLLNSHKNFCINYFIDEDNLKIPDKNIFTAVEIASLLPMVNDELYQKFNDSNSWVADFLPNAAIKNKAPYQNKITFLKSFTEKLFSGTAGDYLAQWSMNKTLSYWKKKYKLSTGIDFKNSIRTKTGVAKYHPNHFQDKVLQSLGKKIKRFETETGYVLFESEKEVA